MYVPVEHPDGGFDVTARVSNKDIAGLLSTAFESGVGYWCVITDIIAPPDPTVWLDRKDNGDLEPEGRLYRRYDYPVTPGGAVIIADAQEYEDDPAEAKTYRIDRESITRGLAVMQQKYPKQFSDFVTQNYDAITGDVFIQCCAFGEIIYG